MPYSSKEKRNEYNRRRFKDPIVKEKTRLRINKYRNSNKEKVGKWCKEYRDNNYEKLIEIETKSRRLKRKKWIKILTDYGFSSCLICGYNKSIVAIDCHHVDPSNKLFRISSFICGKIPTPENIELLKTELLKCIPLCANCHREYHEL